MTRFATVLCAIAVALGAAAAAWAAFSSTTQNVSNFSAATDLTAPTVTASTVANQSGINPGKIRTGGNYYVYANATDAGNPASGIASLSANLSTFDTGQTAVALTSAGGPWTVNAISYTYRSAVLTSNTGLIPGNSYAYTVTATDNAGLTSAAANYNAVIETYAEVIGATSPLGYWKLDHRFTTDTMTDTNGTTLQTHTGELGATWTQHSTSENTAVITNANRVRKNGTAVAVYSSSATPPTADYAVEADIRVVTSIANDAIGVLGRFDIANANGTWYLMRYTQANTRWEVWKSVNGTQTSLGTFNQTLTAGTTYHIRLEMIGTAIKGYVDGVQRISVTDGSITAAGLPGVRLGSPGSAVNVTNTTGYHMDNFAVYETFAEDSAGTNDGTLGNFPSGTTGALVNDPDWGMTFDGTNDYVRITRGISDDFSIEFWFRSTAGAGAGGAWTTGSGLVDANTAGTTNDFGISLSAAGRVLAGTGNADTTIQSGTGFNDGNWHQVVFTRVRTSGALVLYVDGVQRATGTGGTNALTASANIDFGRLQTAANYLNGSLDEVAIYTTALSGPTVTDHYNAGKGTG